MNDLHFSLEITAQFNEIGRLYNGPNISVITARSHHDPV